MPYIDETKFPVKLQKFPVRREFRPEPFEAPRNRQPMADGLREIAAQTEPFCSGLQRNFCCRSGFQLRDRMDKTRGKPRFLQCGYNRSAEISCRFPADAANGGDATIVGCNRRS